MDHEKAERRMGMETKTIGIEDLKYDVLYVRDAISDYI